jgi:hypothetical protein
MNRRALEGKREGAGERAPRHANERQQPGVGAGNQGKYEEAEEMNRRALEG